MKNPNIPFRTMIDLVEAANRIDEATEPIPHLLHEVMLIGSFLTNMRHDVTDHEKFMRELESSIKRKALPNASELKMIKEMLAHYIQDLRYYIEQIDKHAKNLSMTANG